MNQKELIQTRKKLGVSQAKMAEITKLSLSTVTKLEQGVIKELSPLYSAFARNNIDEYLSKKGTENG